MLTMLSGFIDDGMQNVASVVSQGSIVSQNSERVTASGSQAGPTIHCLLSSVKHDAPQILRAYRTVT